MGDYDAIFSDFNMQLLEDRINELLKKLREDLRRKIQVLKKWSQADRVGQKQSTQVTSRTHSCVVMYRDPIEWANQRSRSNTNRTLAGEPSKDQDYYTTVS